MNKKKLMALALAASIAVGGVATPFTSFATTDDNPGGPADNAETGKKEENAGADAWEKAAAEAAEKERKEKEAAAAEENLQAAVQKLSNAIGRARTALNQNGNKSPNTIAELRAAIDKAEAALNDNANRTVAGLNNATASVEAATTKLVNAPAEKDLQAAVQKLSETIGKARTALNQNGNKSPNTIAELRAAIDKAEAVLNDNANRTVASLNNATASVEAATKKLVDAPDEKKFQAAVFELSETIGKARAALNQNTKKSKEETDALRKVIDEADAYLNDNANRTLSGIVAATAKVKAATEKFVKSPDMKEDTEENRKEAKRELLANLERGKKYLGDKKYTKASRRALAKAIKDGYVVYENKNATVAEIVASTKTVSDAIYNLKLVTPIKDVKEAKRELLANLERGKKYLNDKKYTKASRYRLEKAIKAGYAVYKNTNASLEEVIAANKNVSGAIYNLELVNVKKPVKKVRKARKVLPQTGVESMSAMAMAAAALVGAGLVAARKRK